MNYIWDEKKNRSNIKKHGISFENATFAFDDENKIVLYDFDHSNNEDRYIVIGKYKDIIYVVYTVRTDTIRIISARKATRKERKLYVGTLLS